MKDELRAGRTFRNSAQRAYQSAFRTILVADLCSFIGALVLWSLTVGFRPCFAFFLGLATLADIVVSYFYTRPAVILQSRSRFFQNSSVLAVELGEGALDETGHVPERRSSVFSRLYHGETTYDFYGKRRRGFHPVGCGADHQRRRARRVRAEPRHRLRGRCGLGGSRPRTSPSTTRRRSSSRTASPSTARRSRPCRASRVNGSASR